jgi:hypothetical protein
MLEYACSIPVARDVLLLEVVRGASQLAFHLTLLAWL